MMGLHGFHDTKLTPIVKNAYHAISIHDQRELFCPTMMETSSTADQFQQVEQVWFPGMHSDVGGGSGQDDNILSYHSLLWMMEKANKLGLHFNAQQESQEEELFIYNDSYEGLAVYKMVPRKDRVIEKDELANKYMESQIYRKGNLTSYLKQQDLDKYLSRTLQNFYKDLNHQQEGGNDIE
jgi:hypothetical protein